MPELVVLIGMPGVGKTTVGAALAELLGWRFVDTDDLVSAATGRDVPELIAAEGIETFRDAERAAVVELAEAADGVVIAAGGGTVLDPDNRAALAKLGPVVWLRAAPATLVQRVGDDHRERPLLAGDAAGAIDRLLDERSELYAALATTVVDVDDRTVEEAANDVLVALRVAP